MSVEALAVTLHHSRAHGTAKLVLLGIANHDGDAGSFPKAATLAKYANVHPRRIPAALKQLVELGEIRIAYKEGGQRNLPEYLRPNVYEILVTCPEGCDRTTQHRVRDEDGELVTYSRAQKGRRPVDKKPGRPVKPSDENSTSAENSTTPSAENSTTPSAENSTTKNHPLEPPIEYPGLPESGTSPADATICWACGQPRASKHRTYCRQCESEGKNNPMISCVHDGCDSGVRRRTHPGQQYFRCAEHRDEKQPLTGAGAA